MTALPLQNKISQESSLGAQFRTKISQFGDGYSQRTPDGINNKIDTWNISWKHISSIEKNNIVTILNSVGGHDVLTWTPIDETVEKKFIISEGYSISTSGGDVYSVSTTLKQVFDL
jgi:phage-related protein